MKSQGKTLGRIGCAVMIVAGWCFGLLLPAEAAIDYRVSLAQRNEHIFRVAMTVPDVKDSVDVQMPAWNALYQVRDFASRVVDLRARDSSGKALSVSKRDLHTWRISGSGTVVVEYGIFWDDAGPFASQLDNDHAFLNLAMVLLYVPGRRGEAVSIEFAHVPQDWAVAVALRADDTTNLFHAAGYDALVDAPVEIGRFEQFRFEEEKARIRVAVHARTWNRASLEDKLRRIVAYQVKLMGEAPFGEFLFIYHFGAGGGGMEHSNSTAISSASDSTTDGVTAHEFFHLWNVKRIRPKSLDPVDYTRENITRALWFAEGVTSTYASYTLVRAGLWSAEQFYSDLAGEISQLEQRPASRWKSAEEASLDAWFEKYRPYRQSNFSISYYNKGHLLGVLLDIAIRDATDNKRSLDHVLRHLNEEYAHRGRAYDDSHGIRAAAEKVAGVSLESFFSRYVAGVEPLPYADLLAKAGLQFEMQGDRARIQELSGVSDRQRRIREGLLRGTHD